MIENRVKEKQNCVFSSDNVKDLVSAELWNLWMFHIL